MSNRNVHFHKGVIEAVMQEQQATGRSFNGIINDRLKQAYNMLGNTGQDKVKPNMLDNTDKKLTGEEKPVRTKKPAPAKSTQISKDEPLPQQTRKIERTIIRGGKKYGQ